jgi:hypothetical protein
MVKMVAALTTWRPTAASLSLCVSSSDHRLDPGTLSQCGIALCAWHFPAPAEDQGGAQSRAGRAGASRASEPILARGSSSNCNVEWRQTWKRVLPIGTCQLPRDRATSRFLTVSKFQRHAAAHAVAQLNRRMATWRDDGIEHAARSLISGQPARHIWPTSADQDCFFQS